MPSSSNRYNDNDLSPATMSSKPAVPYYSVRTKSGKTVQMSQEEMSQLVRMSMKRAKEESPRRLASTRAAPYAPSPPRDTPTNKQKSHGDARNPIEEHSGNDACEDGPNRERKTESYTVNTEQGSQLLSQEELNMLIRKSMMKAREARPDVGSRPRRPTSTKVGKVQVKSVEKCTASPHNTDRHQSLQDKQTSDAMSLAEWSDASQLTEPSCMRRISEELKVSGTSKLASEKYLDNNDEENGQEVVLHSPRKMMIVMGNTSEPIASYRSVVQLSPIMDDDEGLVSVDRGGRFQFNEDVHNSMPNKSHSPRHELGAVKSSTTQRSPTKKRLANLVYAHEQKPNHFTFTDKEKEKGTMHGRRRNSLSPVKEVEATSERTLPREKNSFRATPLSPSAPEDELLVDTKQQAPPTRQPTSPSPRQRSKIRPILSASKKHAENTESDGRAISDHEIERIVNVSMGKAQQSAREEIQGMLHESKRHKDMIGVKTADGYNYVTQDEITAIVKESMQKAKEAAQQEIAELVRESMRQARESAQAEIAELLQDSICRARESAKKEMSDIVKESLRQTRADDSTAASVSAFTLSSLPVRHHATESNSMPTKVMLSDVVEALQENLSGSLVEGSDDDEQNQPGRVVLPLNEDSSWSRIKNVLDSPSPFDQASSEVPEQLENDQPPHESPHGLEGTLVVLDVDVANNVDEVEVTLNHETTEDEPATMPLVSPVDNMEEKAVVKASIPRQTCWCSGYGSVHSSDSDDKKLELKEPEENTEGTVDETLPDLMESEGSGENSQYDHPHLDAVLLSRCEDSDLDIIDENIESLTLTRQSASNASVTPRKNGLAKAPSRSLRRYEKNIVPHDNLAPLSPSAWAEESTPTYSSDRDDDSYHDEYQRRHNRTPLNHRASGYETSDAITVTDELLAQMANLKGSSITQDQLNKLLVKPTKDDETIPVSKSMTSIGEFSAIESRGFCFNLMDLITGNGDDHNNEPLRSLSPHHNARWLQNIDSDTDLDATFSGSYHGSFSYSTFSEDSDDFA